MKGKTALFAVAFVALAMVALAPVTDLSADDSGDILLVAPLEDGEMYIMDDGSDSSDDRNYLYEAVLIIVVALIFAGYAHVSYYAKKKQQ